MKPRPVQSDDDGDPTDWPGSKEVSDYLSRQLAGRRLSPRTCLTYGRSLKGFARWMHANGGLLTEADFAIYVAKPREPLRTTYRGHQIIGFPPPSSGGVHVAQILNILEHFDLKALGANSPDFVHVVAEAMKLAFADRAHWLGDPDFASVPRGLVDKGYAAQLAKKIDLKKATPVPQHHTPPNATKSWQWRASESHAVWRERS